MSMINHMIFEKKEKEKINKEISRNYSIIDEVTDLTLNIEKSREIIIDNLMFDYLILIEESKELMILCKQAKIDFNEIDLMVKTMAVKFLRKDFDDLKISKMTWNEVSNNIIRVDKRLILSKIKEQYPNVYLPILSRAKETTEKIIRGIN